MNIDVNCRNKRRYKTARYPMHQGNFWTWPDPVSTFLEFPQEA